MTTHRVELHTAMGEVLDPLDRDAPLSYPVDFVPTIPALLHRSVEHFGDRPCVVTTQGSISFREIEAMSRRLAKHLVERGVGKGTRVAMLFPQGPEWIATFFAAARVGAMVMPFSTFYTPDELARSCRHGDVELLIVADEMFGRDMVDFVLRAIPGLSESEGPRVLLTELPYLRSVTSVGAGGSDVGRAWLSRVAIDGEDRATALVTDELLAAIESEISPADQLMTIFTSGTTSEPKGVVHTHGSQVRHGVNMAAHRNYSPETRLFAHMPFFWVGGFTCTLLPAIYTGAVLITQPKFDANEALDLIQREQATHLIAWPNLKQRLLDHPSYPCRDLSSIGFLPSPGDPTIDPGLMHNSLGMTETSGPHSAGRFDELANVLPEHHRGSFGRRVPHVQHRLADPDTNKTVADGEIGEVCIRGYSVMAGLYKVEREQTFDADGWFHTGDKAHYADGLLFFHGRYGEMIKTAGSNVAPREVEIQLEKMPGVKAAIVFGLPDAERGELVVAAVTATVGSTLEPTVLLDSLRSCVSAYKVPRELVVICDDDIALLGSGKPDRRAVRKLVAAQLGRDC